MKNNTRKTIIRLIAVLIMFMCFVGIESVAENTSFDPSMYSDEELQQIQEIISNELYARAQEWAKEHGDRKISFESYEISIARGKTVKMVPTITRNIDTAPEKTKLVWTSDDENVASVKDGSIQAKGVGNCRIICQAADNELINSAIAVNVFEPVKVIKADVVQATVEIGSYIIPKLSFEPENATYKEVEWLSSDETIAEVSASFGRIVALEKGDCIITAKATDGSEKKVDIRIHVPAFSISEDEYHFSESDGIVIPVVYSGISYSDLKITGENDAKVISWSVDNKGIHILPKRRGECTLKISQGKDAKTIKIYNEISLLDANKALNVGDTVCFGNYEQDSNTGNGKEAIRWIITEINNSTAVLTSEKILDWQPYAKNGKGKDSGEISVKDSTLFNWLNKDFKKAAFTSDDAEAIMGDINIPQIVIGEEEALIVELNKSYILARIDKRERNKPGLARVKAFSEHAYNLYTKGRKTIQWNPTEGVYWCNNGEIQFDSGNIMKASDLTSGMGVVPTIKIDLSAIILSPVKK